MPPRVGFYHSTRSKRPKVSFKLACFVSWPSDLTNDMLGAIAVIWTAWVDKTVELIVGFLDVLPGDSIGAYLGCAAYSDEDGTFQFSKERIFEGRAGKELRFFALQCAAHEAMHAVQCYRGENPVPIDTLINDVDELESQLSVYSTTPSEGSADSEANRFVRAVNMVEGTLPIEASADVMAQRYQELWTRHRSRNPLFNARELRA